MLWDSYERRKTSMWRSKSRKLCGGGIQYVPLKKINIGESSMSKTKEGGKHRVVVVLGIGSEFTFAQACWVLVRAWGL